MPQLKFKVGDRVRYIGHYVPFYVSPFPGTHGTVVEVPPADSWAGNPIKVTWGSRLRYCKETDTRTWSHVPGVLELVP